MVLAHKGGVCASCETCARARDNSLSENALAGKTCAESGVNQTSVVHVVLPSVASVDLREEGDAVSDSASPSAASSAPVFQVGKSRGGEGGGGEGSAVSGVPCDAKCDEDGKWKRGMRGGKTEIGYFVTFDNMPGYPKQDTPKESIRLRPNWWKNLQEEDMISLEQLSRLRCLNPLSPHPHVFLTVRLGPRIVFTG